MPQIQYIRDFVAMLWRKRSTIIELARRDMIAEHGGTYLGTFWVYFQPLAQSLIIFLVFTIGLRGNPGGKVHYSIFLISGMIAWQFFSGTLSALTHLIQAHVFLVKKGDLSLSLLHLARLLAASFPHLVLLLLSLVIAWLNGFPPSVYAFQLLYYLAAMEILLLGLGWITSSTSLFIEDIGNLVTLLLQFGFWLTPIIWNFDIVPSAWRWAFMLNPMSYVVNGYRDSLFYYTPFWARPVETICFWTMALGFLVLGAAVFRRLRPHFGEVV